MLQFRFMDTRTMIACVYCVIEAVVSSGGSAPNLDELRKRLAKLAPAQK